MFKPRTNWAIGMVSMALWTSGLAQAAVSPPWRRASELNAVITVATKALGDRLIDEIERLDIDRYRVRAGACSMEVRLRQAERSSPGPQQLEATAGPISCR